MDGLSGAASVITVVDLSAKIASLCFQYSVAVKNAKEDIQRLQRKVNDIKDILEQVKQLLDGQDKVRVSATSKLSDSSLQQCFLQLEELKTRLEPGKSRKILSRLGVRALKWPFTSKEVEKIVITLEKYKQTFSLALQVDQISLTLDIGQEIDLARLPIATGASDSYISIYQPLSSLNGQTRLVQIEHAVNPEEKIRCRLQVVGLEERPSFTALSYVWGDPKSGAEGIVLNDRPWTISANLAVALRHFRHGYREDGIQHTNYLWVDALSINQADRDEKAAQVGQMDRIYRSATIVLSHLGAGTDATTEAISALRLLGHGWKEILEECRRQAMPDDQNISREDVILLDEEKVASLFHHLGVEFTDTSWACINEFLALPYWSRIWIVQELVLGSENTLVAGDSSIHWQDIVDAMSFCRKLPGILSGFEKYYNSLWDPFKGSAHLHWEHIDLIRRLKGEHYLKYNGKVMWTHSLRVVAKASAYLATDPRDKIFGLHGICQLPMTPTYSASTSEVYVKFTIGCVLRQIHNIILWGGTSLLGTNDLNLPTWAPNWQRLSRSRWRHPIDPEWYQADGWIDPFPAESELEPRFVTPMLLRIRGHGWDTVDRVQPPLALQSRTLFEFCADLVSRSDVTGYQYPTGIPILQALMRLFLLDHRLDESERELDFATQETDEFDRLIEHILPFLSLIMPEDSFHDGNQHVLANRLEMLQVDPKTQFGETIKANFFPTSTCNLCTTIDLSGYNDEELARMFPDDTKSPEQIRRDPVIQRLGVDIVNPMDGYPAIERMKERMSSWMNADYRFFQTKSGHLGVGPFDMQQEDVVCVVDRCSTPVILRAHGNRPGVWVLIGSCFVLGIMDGEVKLESVSEGSTCCFEVA